jgi:hypothetical protein
VNPCNLITLQRREKLRRLELQILSDHWAGYGVDADRLLDQWRGLSDSLQIVVA